MHKMRESFFVVKPWTRHSLILIMAGVGYIFTGIIKIFTTPTETQKDALYYAVSIMPMHYWGVGFIIIGLIAFLSSRWPVWPKTFGYTVLTGWSSAWAAFYIIGGIAAQGQIVYFSTGAVWALVAFLWWAISGLVSPEELAGDA